MKRAMRGLVRMGTALGIVVLYRSARAEQSSTQGSSAAPPLRRPEVTVRLGVPLTGGLWCTGPGCPGYMYFGGGSASVRYAELEGELGLHYWYGCANGPSITPRLGISAALLRTPDWSVRIPVLASYSYGSLSGGNCDANGDVEFHLLGSVAGIDVTFRRFDVRLVPFVGYGWFHFAPGAYSEQHTRGLTYTIALEVGFIAGHL